MSAPGDRLPNLGEKQFDFVTETGMSAKAKYQVADVTRALCSVSRVCDNGNTVTFTAAGGYITGPIGIKTPFRRGQCLHVGHLGFGTREFHGAVGQHDTAERIRPQKHCIHSMNKKTVTAETDKDEKDINEYSMSCGGCGCVNENTLECKACNTGKKKGKWADMLEECETEWRRTRQSWLEIWKMKYQQQGQQVTNKQI